MICAACGEENVEHARFCHSCGARLASVGGDREVRKTVTVVFCDLTGSTTLAERHDPEAVRHVISRYFDEMRAVVLRHGGTVEKFIGDAVMAVFGVPQVHEDDPLRAVRAASEMRSSVDALNQDLPVELEARLQVRIGVETGEVVVTDPGTAQSFVVGDVVNVAARLEQRAMPGEILLGPTTYGAVHRAVGAEPVGTLDLKGKTEPIAAVRLDSVDPPTVVHHRRLDAPMIGRDRSLRLVRQAFENAVADGACELVTVLGPAGVGKSRLVEEFVRGLDDAAVYRGRCVPYGEGMTYFPVVEIVRQAIGAGEFESRDRIAGSVSALVQGEHREEAIAERIVELAVGDESEAPEETFWAVRRFLEALAARSPIVVVLDDLQWAQPTFLDLVEHVAASSRDATILLLAMSRPELLETHPTWGGGMHRAISIWLEPLSDADCDRLIGTLLDGAALDRDILGRITRAAAGNPLFLEEMVASLIDEGSLVQRAGTWRPRDELEDVPVPSSIAALLETRLDQLPVAERAVLERASIAGAEFLGEAVRALSPDDERSMLDEHLDLLVRRDIIRIDRSAAPSQERYRFRHILIRDAAYEAMPKQLRADLHVVYADWLATAAHAGVSEPDELIGYHLERSHRLRAELGFGVDARIAARAAEHLRAAGRRAALGIDFVGAVNLLGRSTELLEDDDPRKPEALWEYGVVLNRLGDNADANRVLSDAAARAAASGDAVLEARARIDRCFARFFWTSGRAEVRREVATLLPVLRERRDHLGITKALQLVAFDDSHEGRYRHEAAVLDEALAHARIANDRLEQAEILTSRMDSIWLGPTPVEQAIAQCDAIVADPRIDRRTEAIAQGRKAILVAMLGRFDEARAMVLEARAMQRELGLHYSWFETAAAMSTIEWVAGDPAASERVLLRPEHQAPAEDATLVSARDALLVRAWCAQERFDEAWELTERPALVGEIAWARVMLCAGRGRVLAARGEHDEAEETARRAVEIASATDSPTILAESKLDLARVLQASGRPTEGSAAAQEAAALFVAKGDIASERRAETLADVIRNSAV